MRISGAIPRCADNGTRRWTTTPAGARRCSICGRAQREIWAALRRDAAPGSTTFVLSHGALGRTLLGTALGLEPSMFRDDHYEFGNADLVKASHFGGGANATTEQERRASASGRLGRARRQWDVAAL